MEPNCYPDDKISAMEHVTKSKAMYRAEPAMQAVSLQMKYRTVRGILLKAWRKHALPAQRSSSSIKSSVQRPASWRKLKLVDRSKRMRRVLLGSLKMLAKTPYSKIQPQNCNRFRYRESGPTKVYQAVTVAKIGSHFLVGRAMARGIPTRFTPFSNTTLFQRNPIENREFLHNFK